MVCVSSRLTMPSYTLKIFGYSRPSGSCPRRDDGSTRRCCRLVALLSFLLAVELRKTNLGLQILFDK